MIKKILAVVLAAVLVMLCFASCKNKPKQDSVDGRDQPVAYNDGGYAIFDENNAVRIYDTDSNGKIIYNEDGTPQYKYFDSDGVLIHDGILDTRYYAFAMPKGWSLSENGVFTKDGTDGKCLVKVTLAAETGDGVTFDSYIMDFAARNDEYIEKLKESGINVEPQVEYFTLGANQCNAFAATFKWADENGELKHYATSIYFLSYTNIYLINYLCSDGVGYDESFDFVSYVKENFVTKTVSVSN